MASETEVLDILDETEEVIKYDYPIKIDRFDKSISDEMRELSPNWREIEEKRQEESKIVPPLMDTIFHGLWQPRPIPRNPDSLTKTGKRLSELLEAVSSTKEWKQLRLDTRYDEVASAIATAVLTRDIELPADPPPKDGEQDGDGQGDADGEHEPLTDAQLDSIRQQARAVMREAVREIEDQRDMEGLLWGSPGDDNPELKTDHNARDRIEFAKKFKNNRRLKELAELVGRFTFVAKQKFRRRVKHGRDEISDIILGNNLADMVPGEWIRYRNPRLRKLFLLDYVEQRLSMFKFDAAQKVGRGPICACFDISPSMTLRLTGGDIYNLSTDSVTKIDWAVATVLALSVFAKKEKRDLHLIAFNHAVVKTWDFPKGEWAPEHIFEIASLGTSGGTYFDPPLRAALQYITKDPHVRADIVFITDGLADVSKEFLEEYQQVKAAKEFMCRGIILHPSGHGILDVLCDECIDIGDLKAAAKALDMAYSL